jgi:hypothetical protein
VEIIELEVEIKLESELWLVPVDDCDELDEEELLSVDKVEDDVIVLDVEIRDDVEEGDDDDDDDDDELDKLRLELELELVERTA